ncbi:CHAP domain-containing protein [Streptosporangium amethystogenes subsp. fukuiense]|uniref:CHAP domain-containing protein n=1 Tax=Streptosporangium amethystogenes subsp. fukuiense TaxID=698418 RepID=A0ABW2SU31_9ACTN
MTKHRLTPTLSAPRVASALLGACVVLATGSVGSAALADSRPALNTPPADAKVSEVSQNRPASTPLEIAAERLPKVSAAQVLDLAAKQIGVRENSQGGGTKFHSWYMSSPRAKETVARDGGSIQGYANAPWCAMFVSWVGEMAGIRPTMGWDAYTVTHAKWFKNNQHWGTTPTPGAVVYFDWAGGKDLDGIDHVGFVKKDNGDGTITTIEGNTGNGNVEQRVRPTSQVVGYGYPVYAD